MKTFVVLLLFGLGALSVVLAQDRKTFPPITFQVPESNSAIASQGQFVVLVIESAYLSHNGIPIPTGRVIDYVNTTMVAQNAPYLTVHVREGITYANVVAALGDLSKTETKGIALSMAELPAGGEI